MTVQRFSRRSVVRAGGASALGLCVTRVTGPVMGALGANERIRVGIIGPGDRGRSLMSEFLEQSGPHNAELTAVCDLWSLRRNQAQAIARGRSGRTPGVFRNTEELYNARSVDAVIIATPDFSHAILCGEAVRAGMDVYVEKPLAHVLDDARLVREACRQTGRVVQVGTDSRSSGLQRAAADYVQSGKLGRVHSIELGWHVYEPRRWRRDQAVASLREADTDWDRYQLNRRRRAFDARRYLEFRLFWPYSSGLPDQWLSHNMDTVAHVTGELYPASCVASGAITQWHDGRENADELAAVFDYPSGMKVRYSAGQSDGSRGEFARFLADSATLDLNAGAVIENPPSGPTAAAATRARGEKLGIPPDVSHVGNWLECIRSRSRPAADIEAGYAHSVAVCMAVQALQTGRRVHFDAVSHAIGFSR